ncbi:MAG: cysteine hydrolase [Firmicutes bacterium]|jgi:nicotinamidase-related amidase|nr:cysteine hydrolase [Bacillota bacterium]
MNKALVIIDMQPFFFRNEERRVRYEDLIKNINEMIEYADNNNIKVFHVKTIHKKDKSTWNLVMKKHNFVALLEEDDNSKFIEEINIKDHHEIVVKTRQSTFIRTDFQERLRNNNIDTVIVSGVFTHGCVGRTAIDAYEHDFNVILAKDCSFSHLKDQEQVMFDVITKEQEQLVLSNQEIISMV